MSDVDIDSTARPVFDEPEQLQKIQDGLVPGETVLAVYDGKGAATGSSASPTVA